MKYLDEGQRRALGTLYPFLLTHDRTKLARDWREARQSRPGLTKEEFVRNDLKWAPGEITDNLIRQQLEYLVAGRKALSEQRTPIASPSCPRSSRARIKVRDPHFTARKRPAPFSIIEMIARPKWLHGHRTSSSGAV